jgi:hypothetical protein
MKLTILLSLVLAASAQPQPKADNCVPPPSSLAPTLPAKLLPGMGTVHLAITTSSPEAQQFFDQGVAQMHSFWAREVAGGTVLPKKEASVSSWNRGRQSPAATMATPQ